MAKQIKDRCVRVGTWKSGRVRFSTDTFSIALAHTQHGQLKRQQRRRSRQVDAQGRPRPERGGSEPGRMLLVGADTSRPCAMFVFFVLVVANDISCTVESARRV